MLRAALEGTAYGVRHNLEVLAEVGARPKRLVAVGGGAAGELWPTVVSDVTGREQELPVETVGAAYGDAFLAAAAVGLADPAATWSRTRRVVRPDPGVRDRYEELYALYRSLYPATREHAHALARLQRLG